jgi:hypothetical protein
VKEGAKKKKYARDGENPDPWKVEALALTKKDADPKYEEKRQEAKAKNISSWDNFFYPASEFAVKNYLFSKGTIARPLVYGPACSQHITLSQQSRWTYRTISTCRGTTMKSSGT